MPLIDKLKKGSKRPAKSEPTKPPWAGPCGTGSQGGVTQSLISRWLCCRERFRVKVIDGWESVETYNDKLEAGNMWHVCEEALAKAGVDSHADAQQSVLITNLTEYCQDLCRRFPLDREKIDLRYRHTKALFPAYVAHWSKHPDMQNRTPLLAEQVFDVPYKLPSGRVVRLRGKWDSVDLANGNGGTHEFDGDGRCKFCKSLSGKTTQICPKRPTNEAIWVQENKSKGTIDGAKIGRQCTWDLQTMLYLIALSSCGNHVWPKAFQRGGNETTKAALKSLPDVPIAGVRYNCIKRPAHKSVESMTDKLALDQRCGRADEWFCRFNVHVTLGDLERFRHECLDPVLENMADDYEWWVYCQERSGVILFNGAKRNLLFSGHCPRHFRMPYNIWNVTLEGGFADVDEYINTGSTVGLKRVENLFKELQP